jgi:hypothetical protein
MSMLFCLVSNTFMSWLNYYSIPWLNGNLASAEKFSGPLRFRLRQLLLYIASHSLRLLKCCSLLVPALQASARGRIIAALLSDIPTPNGGTCNRKLAAIRAETRTNSGEQIAVLQRAWLKHEATRGNRPMLFQGGQRCAVINKELLNCDVLSRVHSFLIQLQQTLVTTGKIPLCATVNFFRCWGTKNKYLN